MDPLAQLRMTDSMAVDFTQFMSGPQRAVGLGSLGMEGVMAQQFSPYGNDMAMFSQDLTDQATAGFMPAYAQQMAPMGLNGGMGMVPGFGGMMASMNPQQQQMQQMMQMMMMMLMTMMQMMQQNGMGAQQGQGNPFQNGFNSPLGMVPQQAMGQQPMMANPYPSQSSAPSSSHAPQYSPQNNHSSPSSSGSHAPQNNVKDPQGDENFMSDDPKVQQAKQKADASGQKVQDLESKVKEDQNQVQQASQKVQQAGQKVQSAQGKVQSAQDKVQQAQQQKAQQSQETGATASPQAPDNGAVEAAQNELKSAQQELNAAKQEEAQAKQEEAKAKSQLQQDQSQLQQAKQTAQQDKEAVKQAQQEASEKLKEEGAKDRPNGLKGIKEEFGAPGKNQVTTKMPAGPDGKMINVTCHEKVADRMKAAFEEIKAKGLSDNIDSFDGCYNYRNKRGGSSLSIHSWGIGFDINAGANPMGSSRQTAGQRELAQVFEKYGFHQLENDPMHFQFATGY
ncbi:MAG: M15 family metallopeptidase [Candidatus Eremiobacteraeota bacterium]|nr:M15 family metallopeptidase [Candidatus Eremiobacteraeota bacterium]